MADKYKLKLQQNGMITLETRGANFVRHSVAHNLVFRIMGGEKVYGTFEDEITARNIFKEFCQRHPSFEWKLKASNELGSITLPKNWKGYYS